MKYLIYLIAIIMLIGINLGVFGNLQIKSQIPNLLLLFTLCASLEKKDFDFFFIAFFCGLFLDFYSASFFGSFTFGFLLVALALNFLANRLVMLELNWKSLTLMLLASMLVLNLFLWGYGLLAYKFNLARDFLSFKTFAGAFLVIFLYNLLLLYPVYLFYTFLKRIIDSLSRKNRSVVT